MARLIDADELGIGRCNPDVFENKAYADGWNAAISMIEDATTVDAEPVRHGKWIEVHSIDETTYKCSECNAEYDIVDNYCPNCGAKMQEEIENE